MKDIKYYVLMIICLILAATADSIVNLIVH